MAGVPQPGDTIRVYQLGKPGALSGGGSVLRGGGNYVLFLVPTMMPGANAADYFPTGTFSGIYLVSTDGILSHKPTEEDTLPAPCPTKSCGSCWARGLQDGVPLR